ncbi:MAG: hypothetical protein U1E26_04050 [Coriobacteriia bacterium]|nr:hypothetical protein [Coriobacteriia bacterium]
MRWSKRLTTTLSALALVGFSTLGCSGADPATTTSLTDSSTPEIITPSPGNPSGQEGRQLAYVAGVDRDGAELRLTVDFVVWITGDEAEALEGAEPPNGFYILNQNKRRWVFPVGPDARVVVLEAAKPLPAITPDEFAVILEGERAGWSDTQPYWITVRDDTIVAIEEQYVP